MFLFIFLTQQTLTEQGLPLCPARCLPLAEETKMRKIWSLLLKHLQSSREDNRCKIIICVTKKGLFQFKGRLFLMKDGCIAEL